MTDSEPFVIKPEDIDPFDIPHHEKTTARELVNPNRGSENAVFRLSTLESGGRDDWHAHESSEQLVYTLSGEGIIEIRDPDSGEETRHSLSPETFVYLPSGVYHHVSNPNEEPLELILVWAPPYKSLDEWDAGSASGGDDTPD